jgi:predicted P-loop ATPase
VNPEPEPDPNWQKLLILGKKKKPLTCLSNVVTALTYAPEWCGTLSFNEFTLEILVRKPTPIGAKADHVWTDDDDRETAVWMQQHGVIATSKTVAEAVQVVAHRNPIHPLRDEIDALEWDGVPRLDAWLIDYAGAADMKYTRAVGACWVISMMARLYMPGCKSDYVLGLEGDQGIGKSMLLSILPGRKCFADRVSNLDTKDAMLEMAGILVVEMSELVNMKGATLEKFKAFVSSQDDRFRDPYGRRVAWHPRQCVLCATTNLTEPFTDPTGTRRIWPVRCGVIDIPGLRAVRKQLLAEARVRLKPQSPAISLDGIEGTGERWWLEDEELKKLAAAEQEDRYEPGVWDDNIVEWIAKPEQRWKREGSGTYATTLPVKPWDESEAGKVTITDILVHGLEKDIGHLTQADRNQVKRCLEHEKWRRHQDRTRSEARGKRFYYSPERGEKEFYKDGKRKPKSEGNS